VFAAVRDSAFASKLGTDFSWLVNELLDDDEYFVIEDFPGYMHVQEQAAAAFNGDADAWYRRVFINIAQCGKCT
jgi:glucan phosphorylase